MADQVQKQSKEVAPSGVQDKIQGATTGILSSIANAASWVAAKGQEMVDRLFPPDQRAAVLAKIQSFMLANPKLSTFLGMNLALTGIPLGLFILFSITVAIFAIIVGLLLGLLGAVVFIVFAVGTALCIVLPAIFFTTTCACFLFLWGLGGYYILKWASGSGSGNGEAPEGGAVGDKLNKLVGGRLTGFMDQARSEKAKGGIESYDDKNTKPSDGEKKEKPAVQNGSAQKQVSDSPHKATKATGVDGVLKNGATATGAAKEGLSGGTGVDVPGA